MFDSFVDLSGFLVHVMPRHGNSTRSSPIQLGFESSGVIGHHQSQSRSAARQRQPRPPQDVTRQDQRGEFQTSRGVRCCSAGEDSTVGGSPRHSRQFHRAGSCCAPTSVEEGTHRRRGNASGHTVKECQLFVERKEKKIASIDQERVHEMKLLEEGRAHLERLRKEVEILQQGHRLCHGFQQTGDVQKLQAMVAQLQSEKEEWSKKKDSPRLPEDFVCASNEDLIQWLGERQKDMNDALMAGNAGEVARMVVLVNEGTNQLRQWIGQVQKGVACVRPWWGTSSGESEVEVGGPQVWVSVVEFPGPVQTRQATRAEHDRLTARRQTQIDVSPDEEEPIVRPNIGRHIITHTNGAHGSVDDSDDAPVGRGTQIKTGKSWVPDAFVGTPSMLVSCPVLDVGFAAPRKKLRIRSAVVAVESSEPSLCPVPRMPSVDSVSPQVQVERAGSQVDGFAMGRFAVFATEVEDDGVRVEGVHLPGFSDVVATPCPVLSMNVGDTDIDSLEEVRGRQEDVERTFQDLTQTVWLKVMVMNTSMGLWRAVRMTTLSCPLWNQWHLFCHQRQHNAQDSPSWISGKWTTFSHVGRQLMKTVPRFLWGSFRIALKVAIEEILNGAARRNMVQQERGWKLFLLLPRMMLHRSPRGGLIGHEKLISRFDKFAAGQGHDLILASNKCAEEAATVRQRRAQRVQGNQDERRATRAFNFVQMGELSSRRQALEGEELAPGNEETLKELRKQVAIPRDAVPPVPRDAPIFNLDERIFGRNVRSAKRGAAGGPSAMTTDHLRPLLESTRDLHNLFKVAELLARGQIPESTASTIRRGRMTTLRKDGGGVRGIVAGEVIRRVTARTIVQQLGPAVEVSTAPF